MPKLPAAPRNTCRGSIIVEMDESTLASLESAYRVSPENDQLLMVLLQAYLDTDNAERGLATLEELDSGLSGFEIRFLAARIALETAALARARRSWCSVHPKSRMGCCGPCTKALR